MSNATTSPILFVLGAADPEMEAIERLLTESKVPFVYATDPSGRRVHPGNMYRAVDPRCPVCGGVGGAVGGDGLTIETPCHAGPHHPTVVWVECHTGESGTPGDRLIDHHRPGDAGYGRPPEEFLSASSIGQVIATVFALSKNAGKRALPGGDFTEWFGDQGQTFFRHWVNGDAPPELYPEEGEWFFRSAGPRHAAYVVRVPVEIILAAAADHCLGSAYRGECPGVDPDALMRWRAESRARFQKRDVAGVMADIESAQQALEKAPVIHLGADLAQATDLRGLGVIPELVEAATRYGICYVTDGVPVDRDGRRKVVCSGNRDQIRAFMGEFGPQNGLVDIYGDPSRGFAGGYLPA